MKIRRWQTVTTGMVVLALTILLMLFSEQGYKATTSAIQLFFRVVFPSLLPFFILSEVLLGLGVVHFLGVLFEPFMRPLFNVPGVGSFVFSMGLAAGYPMDAVLTAKFRRAGLCTRIEGERLLAFTNTADPLFLLGAVSVGMFGSARFGVALALAHYASCLIVGLCYRFYGGRDEAADPRAPRESGRRSEGILKRAVDELVRARSEDGRPLGKMLSDAISESISTLFMIMSFMVLFAVLIRIFAVTGVLRIFEVPLAFLLQTFGMSPSLTHALIQGLFEIDLGTAQAAAASAPLAERLLVCSAIVAWSGLSVHGQVASVLSGTDIRMGPYFAARLLHAVVAALLTPFFLRRFVSDVPVLSSLTGTADAWGGMSIGPWLLGALTVSSALAIAVTLALCAGAALFYVLRAARIIRLVLR